jgi:conjugative relaxase-like TrwC/TraI family protein
VFSLRSLSASALPERPMLSTSNVSAEQAETYYTQDDYYSRDAQQKASRWAGKAAAKLGLAGNVESETFQQLLNGMAPDGQLLSGKQTPAENRRAATDYTFSAPKSVSIAALVQQDDRVLAAHHQAVTTALTILEQRYALARQMTATGRQRVLTGNLMAAVFTHTTSREMEPQLHSHCVVMNATQLPDGQWRSFSNEAAIAHQKLLGEIYQNELAVALKQQGYEIEPKANGQFELAGYTPELLKLFSTRRQQMEQLMAIWDAEGTPILDANGEEIRSSAARREAAALRSRKQKPKDVDPNRLFRGWNALIQLKGLELPAIPQPSQEANVQDVIQFSENIGTALENAIQHCGERESVFKQTHLERFVLEHHLGEQSFERLERAIAHNDELIQIDDNKYTTQSALNLELNTIRMMQGGKGHVRAIATPNQINTHLEGKTLTLGQRDAIQLASTTNDQFIAWQGVAGSGKTFALSEFSAIAQAQGYSVRGFAPSAEAAHGLGKTLQIETQTVAGLLVAQTHGDKQQPEIWIVDEAGLLSMREAHDLLNRASAEKARVILVGDTKQLSSVAAGNPFKSLQAGGMATAQLDETLRQQTYELRIVVNQVAQGKVVEGIQTLAAAGCIQKIPKNEERSHQFALDYLNLSAEERQRTLLLAGTHQSRWELTKKIRQGLQAAGELKPDALTVSGLRPKDLTVAQAAYSSAYAPGDVVVPNQDYKKQGLVKNQQYRVLGGDRASNQLTLETPSGQVITVDPAQCAKKTVYQVQSMPVAVGDRLRWTKNDRATGIRNGQTFVVQQVASDGTAQICDQEGNVRPINLNRYPFLDYAWVSTTYSSQGKTGDRVMALLDGMTINRESFYVTVSRAKHHLMLYTADITELTQRAQKLTANENVSDYIPLFQVYTHAQTQKAQTNAISATAATAIHRDLGQRIGDGVGERLCQKLAADFRRDHGLAATGEPPGAGDAAGAGDFPSPPPNLDRHVAPLSTAIADYLEQQALIECTGEFAAAGAAIDYGLEHLEQSTQRRTQFAAAVARLDAAIGKQAGGAEPNQCAESERVQPQGSAAPTLNRGTDSLPVPATHPPAPPLSRTRCQRMWQQYSQGMQASNPVKLDYLVGRRAFAAGQSQKEIARMLVVGSAYVRQLEQAQGKEQARNYVNQTARAVCQMEREKMVSRERSQKSELGL